MKLAVGMLALFVAGSAWAQGPAPKEGTYVIKGRCCRS
jgi:hypothetical protein